MLRTIKQYININVPAPINPILNIINPLAIGNFDQNFNVQLNAHFINLQYLFNPIISIVKLFITVI